MSQSVSKEFRHNNISNRACRRSFSKLIMLSSCNCPMKSTFLFLQKAGGFILINDYPKDAV